MFVNVSGLLRPSLIISLIMILVDRLSMPMAFSGHIHYWCFKSALPSLHVRLVQYICIVVKTTNRGLAHAFTTYNLYTSEISFVKVIIDTIKFQLSVSSEPFRLFHT